MSALSVLLSSLLLFAQGDQLYKSFPGPVIRVHKGDTVYVNVQNQGDYGLTIHWHGVHLPRNPWSDGPEYVRQCPIESGSNYTCEVIFSEEEGTLWWHAHSDWTRAGVHGAIVVVPLPETGFPFDEPDGEENIVFGVWFWHCHLDRHLSWGMNTVMIVKDGGTPETSMRKPPSYMPPCTDSSTIKLQPFHHTVSRESE